MTYRATENIALPEEPASVRKRRLRKANTVSQMVGMYCHGHHGKDARTDVAYCGDRICPECMVLDEYVVVRTLRCRSMESRLSCEDCGNRCYAPAMRQRILEVMRWAGPRMTYAHPIAAVHHMAEKLRSR